MESLNTQEEQALVTAMGPIVNTDDYLWQGCIFKVSKRLMYMCMSHINCVRVHILKKTAYSSRIC